MLRLTRIEKPLANFYASGILNLREKLGPFLWQFPPMFRFDAARLAIDANRKLRHAVESLLRKHDIGLVVADTAGKWPKMFHVTSDFVYVRLHGDIKIYTSGYSDKALESWARRIRAWDKAGRDVYVYFDNDVKVKAPFDALSLMRKLRLTWAPAHATGEEPPLVHKAGNPAWDDLGRR